MKRNYTRLTGPARRLTAEHEVWFYLPDTPMRSELIAHLRTGRHAAVPFPELSDRARRWLDERGLSPQEATT
jgi:hypothetical protein